MKNWKLPAKDARVAKYVEAYWGLEKEAGDTGHNFPKLNPDPSAHLIISAPEQELLYYQGAGCQKGQGSHWILPHRKTYMMNHSSPFQVIGIKFRVGALYSLTGLYSSANLDQIRSVDVAHLIGNEPFDGDRLLRESDKHSDQICNVLDQLLMPWLLKSRDDKHSELVRCILPLLGKVPIAQLNDVLHRSQRTLERSFLRVTGFTLKQCQSMIRLEEILNHLYKLNTADIDWSDLAIQFKFSDQPHLVRYLKSSIGETPGEYARQRDLTIDVYGDFEIP